MSREGSGRRSASLAWLAAGISYFAVGFASSYLQGVNKGDEAWFLQVLYRIQQGDVLYRDIFFGVTPLSVYLALLPASMFGAQVLVLKAIMALAYAISALLTIRLALGLVPHSRQLHLLVLALVVVALPIPNSIYKPIALVFLLACLSIRLSLGVDSDVAPRQPRDFGLLLAAGACAALCFLTDQLFGSCALAALLVSLLFMSRGSLRARASLVMPAAAIIGLSFLGVCAAFLLPIWLSGGWPAFMDYGFLNKGTYTSLAGVSYSDQLELLRPVFLHPSLFSLKLFFDYSVYLLPPAVLLLLVIRWKRKTEERARVAVLALFTLAAFLTIFPRVDRAHFLHVVPLLLLGLYYGLAEPVSRMPSPWAARLRATALIWLALGILAEWGSMIAPVARSSPTISQIPHFQGALLGSREQQDVLSSTAALRSAAQDGPLALILPEAGFYYLASGLRNPTPFDFPLETAFGLHGEQDLINRISAGGIRTVCLQPLKGTWAEALRPVRLEDYVEQRMQPGPDVGPCTIYNAR